MSLVLESRKKNNDESFFLSVISLIYSYMNMVIILITAHKEYVHSFERKKMEGYYFIPSENQFDDLFVLELNQNDNVSDCYDHSLNCCRILLKRSKNPLFFFFLDDRAVSALNTNELDE